MLTDAKVRAAKPRPKSYKLTDANRLFLLVSPSGGKLWRWNYYFFGKQKSMSFGAYPRVSLADARSKRDEAQQQLLEGHDPALAKKLAIARVRQAAQQTFEAIAREWHENGKSQWAVVHQNDIIRSLERDVSPLSAPSRSPSSPRP
ncbi:tyrosine-type recombinase/integrase [Sphingomonas sp. AP4-R1]|uniref:tyrosine-type recombinase/integrase n=1 Tax=Sphingomonas sp. AP4-R1 TaxID=2735134 RepID=UPI0034626F91